MVILLIPNIELDVSSYDICAEIKNGMSIQHNLNIFFILFMHLCSIAIIHIDFYI